MLLGAMPLFAVIEGGIMNLGAIAHMPDNRYCYCLQPKHFLIRLQTGRDDLREVIIHYQDKYIPIRFFDTRKKKQMNLVAQDRTHDYFEVELAIDVVCLRIKKCFG